MATVGATDLFCTPGSGVAFCTGFGGIGVGVGAGEEEVEAVGIALAGAGPGPPSLANRFKRIYDTLVSGMDHIIARMRGILSLRRPGGSMPW